jgi:hypothetical protein
VHVSILGEDVTRRNWCAIIPSASIAMTDNQKAALALTVGQVGVLVTMAFHPTGDAMRASATAEGHLNATRVVHALAIAMLPLLTSGMFVLSWRLRAARELSVFAFACYALSVVAVMIAAAASGLLAPAFADAAVSADEALRAVLRNQLSYTWQLNQAFAKIYVGLSAAAMCGWSLAMRRTSDFSSALSALGIAVAVVSAAGVASGHLVLSVHGFGAVMIGQGVWVLWSAWSLARVPDQG